MSNLELAISSSTLCVDDTLGDTLTVEMGQHVNQMEVLEQERTILADSLVLLWVLNGTSIRGGVQWPLRVLESGGGLVISDHSCG